MRIAFLTMGQDIGGAAQDIITLSQGLHKFDHEVYVISSPGVLDKVLANTGVIFINAPLYTRNPVALWRASRQIRKIANRHHLDILNPQGMYTAFSAWMATIGLRKNRFKVVTTIHMISSLSLYRFSRSLNTFSSCVITESYCERNRLVSNGVKMDRVTVVANSVDMERFSPDHSNPVLRDAYQLTPETCCFGIVARLSREKRHQDFIAAAITVHQKHPDTRFFIVGDGPMKESIETLVHGYESFIYLTGMRKDIPDILKSLDCFVLCSEIESLPLSIREAMSMELPVIATDVGGIREAVLEGITGLVVPSCRPDLLAEAMIKIASSKNLRASFGAQGRELCGKNFELSNWVRATEKVFNRILDNSHE